jgi:hypothetical protein
MREGPMLALAALMACNGDKVGTDDTAEGYPPDTAGAEDPNASFSDCREEVAELEPGVDGQIMGCRGYSATQAAIVTRITLRLAKESANTLYDRTAMLLVNDEPVTEVATAEGDGTLRWDAVEFTLPEDATLRIQGNPGEGIEAENNYQLWVEEVEVTDGTNLGGDYPDNWTSFTVGSADSEQMQMPNLNVSGAAVDTGWQTEAIN